MSDLYTYDFCIGCACANLGFGESVHTVKCGVAA